jgi:hypothetical protein
LARHLCLTNLSLLLASLGCGTNLLALVPRALRVITLQGPLPYGMLAFLSNRFLVGFCSASVFSFALTGSLSFGADATPEGNPGWPPLIRSPVSCRAKNQNERQMPQKL